MEYKEFIWKSLDSINTNAKSKIRKGIVKTFKNIESEVLNSIETYFSKSYNKSINIELFNVNSFMTEILENTQYAFYNLSNDIIQLMRSELDGNLPPSQIESIISEASARSSQLISESINTIHSNLKSLIQKIIENNPLATQEELLKLLVTQTKDKFSKVYNISRAELIASTTATFTTTLTQKIVCKKLNYNYQWLTQRDGVVRSSHRDMDGRYPDSNGMFHLRGGSGEHPGAISSAAESCHCRCYLFAVKK